MDICDGVVMPVGFNVALLTLVPKAAPLTVTKCVVAAGMYGPWSLADMVHKCLAEALRSTLEAFRVDTVHPAQCGFVKGRSMALKVAEAQARMEIGPHGGRTGVKMFNIVAAFPSIGWSFAWASLQASGLAG